MSNPSLESNEAARAVQTSRITVEYASSRKWRILFGWNTARVQLKSNHIYLGQEAAPIAKFRPSAANSSYKLTAGRT